MRQRFTVAGFLSGGADIKRSSGLAYGVDLAPLAARAEEFELSYARLQEERQFSKSLRNKITVIRRVIRAKIEKAFENRLKGLSSELRAEFTLMLKRRPQRAIGADKLLHIVEWFKGLQKRFEEAFEAAFDWPDRWDAGKAEVDRADSTGRRKTRTLEV